VPACLGGDPGAIDGAPTPTGPPARRDFGGRLGDVHGELLVETSNATIRMYDRYYQPNVLTGPPGLRVTLMLRNEGTLLHNFTLPALQIAQDVPPTSIVAVMVTLPQEGEIVFFCRFHQDAGMAGVIVAL
jgi:plastocyanin